MIPSCGTREIKELYAGVFKVPHDGGFSETIMCGFYDNGTEMFARSTIEHEAGAIPSLIQLCKEIEDEKGLSWRLLKFDRDGVHELDKQVYEEYLAWVDTHSLM